MNKNKIDFGFRGGLSGTSLSGEIAEDIELETTIGFDIFLWSHYAFSERFGLQLELGYASKGASIELQDNVSIYQNITYNINYAEIPILTTFNISPKIRFLIGPSIAVLVDEEVEFTAFDGLVSGQSNTDDIKTFDFLGTTGIQIDLPFWNGKSSAGIRYNHGLTDITKSDDTDLKNRSLSINYIYRF
ncbi:porin family protein [Aquimarina sp. 2201CG5-10]|uniref:porin family protein n=1 Tax=Aquimarina callyspongiae TaxID=3098150 RepID=UPI002AC9DF66|nr:porin family protein [Aquimarina sp. 2201CG5-10]